MCFLYIDTSQEVYSSQDTSCSQQTTSSTQQPSISQETSSEVDHTSTFQDTSCPKQSDVHDIVDLSDPQYSSTPTTLPDSVELSGLQIYKADLQTVQPKEMITDTIVLFLFK